MFGGMTRSITELMIVGSKGADQDLLDEDSCSANRIRHNFCTGKLLSSSGFFSFFAQRLHLVTVHLPLS